ncbi:MAG: hypothetical protein JW715_07895 [Sedimentisphaerales bacterium]|nr:hypothetical protein [Sedimentisphaerales bacterium]
MKTKDDAFFRDESGNPLDRNISRLVKLADDTGSPSRVFTKLLLEDALKKLSRTNKDVNCNRGKMTVVISQWEKIAAMVAIFCGAGFGVFVSILAHINTVFAGIVLMVMVVNRLIYYGGLIL